MKATPGLCLGRYSRHTRVWTDKDGISRCRRCHAPWAPVPKSNTKYTSRDRMKRREQWREVNAAKKPVVVPPINPACGHPAPFSDPMKAHRYAQECMATGVEQRKCPSCGEWVWSNQFREEATT